MKSPATGHHTLTADFGLRSLEFLPHRLYSNFVEAIPEEQLMSCGAKDCLMGPAATNSTHHCWASTPVCTSAQPLSVPVN